MTHSNSISVEELRAKIQNSLYFEEQWRYKSATDELMSLFASTIEQIAEEGLPKYAKSIGMDVAQLWESPDATDGYNYAIDKARTELFTLAKLIREGEKR